MKSFSFLVLPITLACCNSHDENFLSSNNAQDVPASAAVCGEMDVNCHNDQLMRRVEKEDKLNPKYPAKNATGDWEVTSAIEPVWKETRGTFDLHFEPRNIWLGSKINVSEDAITMVPSHGAPVTHVENLSKRGKLFPHCTKPQFVTDLRQSVSQMENEIEPWRHFDLQPQLRGRYVMVVCSGGPDFGDGDGDDHAELTLEEQESIYSIYLYAPDVLIVGWGDLEFLLNRVRKPDQS